MNFKSRQDKATTMGKLLRLLLPFLLLARVSSAPEKREQDAFLDNDLPGPVYDIPTLPPEMESGVEKRVPTEDRMPPNKVMSTSYEKRIPVEDMKPPSYEKRIPAEDRMSDSEMLPYEMRMLEEAKDQLPLLGKRVVFDDKMRDMQERSGGLKGRRTMSDNRERNMQERSGELNVRRVKSEKKMRDLQERSGGLKGRRTVSDQIGRGVQERSSLQGKRVTAEERRIPYVPPDWPYLPWPYNMMKRQSDEIIYRRTDGNHAEVRNTRERSKINDKRSSKQSRALLKNKREKLPDERTLEHTRELLKIRENERERSVIHTRGKVEKRGMTMDEAKAYDIEGVRSPSQMTGTMAQHAVDLHRMYRLQEPASNMWHMRWNQDLADLAQGLADTCVFKHTDLKFENGTSVGQNLGAVVGPDRTFEFIMKLFYDEKKDYDYSSHSWDSNKAVGHFLQIVYWDSALVGCGFKRCPELYVTPNGQIWKDATYYVCDYWPPASWKDRPYESGHPCSRCIVPADSGLGWRCEVDGCVDCTLGESGCYEPIPCDYAPDKTNCAYLERIGACSPGHKYHQSAKYYCPTTCKVCDGIPDFVKV